MASIRQSLLINQDDKLRMYPQENYGYMGICSLKDSNGNNQSTFGIYDYVVTHSGNKKTSYSNYKEDVLNDHLHSFIAGQDDAPLGYIRKTDDIEPQEGAKPGQEEYVGEDNFTGMSTNNEGYPGPGTDDEDDDDELMPVETDDTDDDLLPVEDDDDDLLIDDDDDDLLGDEEDDDSDVNRSTTGDLGTNVTGREPGRTSGRMIDHEPGTSGS